MEKPMTMVERVARAIYEKRNGAGCKPWSIQTNAHRAPYLDDAKAAIEAMRKPTGGMEDWFRDNLEHAETGVWIWNGAIDAALKEQEKA